MKSQSSFLILDNENIENEHICCAFSDKKYHEGYHLKKEWLKKSFSQGYVFRRLDKRAKVFMEYGPSEYAWVPIDAFNSFYISCFWVSGQYKEQGYGKELLRLAVEDAEIHQRDSLVTIVGSKKYHFMSAGKWLKQQGFKVVDETETGFQLLEKKISDKNSYARFKTIAKTNRLEQQEGLVAYYSYRCPFIHHSIHSYLTETAQNKKIPLTLHLLDSLEKAQNAPTPATIFSLFLNGKFLTTDVSVCIEKRFDKLLSSMKQ